jgi:hypothetical protein
VQVAELLDQRQRPGQAAIAVADARVRAPAPAAGTQVAALAPPPAPRLVAEPKLVDRPSRLAQRPSEDERNRLTQLFALASAPALVAGPAPAPRRPAEAALPSLTGRAATPPTATAPPAPRVAAIDPAAAGGAISDVGSRFGWGSGWVPAPAFDEEHPEELSYRPFPVAPYLTETASPDDPALAVLVHPDVARTLELLDAAGGAPPMRLRPGQQVAALLWAQQFKGAAIQANVFADPAPPVSGALKPRAVKTTGGG